MNGKTKLGLALLVTAFLLVNPAGRCSQLSAANSPANSCHPKTPAPIPQDCGKPGCLYVKAAAIQIAVGSGDDQGQSLAFAAIRAQVSDTLVSGISQALPGVVAAPRDRLLLLHQLLI